MNIVIFGSGQIGRAIARYFLNQPIITQIDLIDINEQQLIDFQSQLSALTSAKKLKLNHVRNIEQLVAHADLIFTAIPWIEHTSIINLIIHYDKPTIIISRPHYHELDQLKIKLQSMTQPVVVGSGLEPGLTEIMAFYCAKYFDKLDSLHIKCGGITCEPPKNLFRYKSLFGTNYLPISIRQAYTVKNKKLILVPRFSDVEIISIANVGKLEAWHDGMVPWLYQYPEITAAHTITQKTLRWPGFSSMVNQLNSLGLLSEDEIKINHFSISPKIFIDHLFSNDTFLTHEKNVTLLRILGHGQINTEPHVLNLMLHVENNNEMSLNSLALLTGFSASIIGLLILNSDVRISGLTHPECVIQSTNKFHDLIHELKSYKVQFDIKINRAN